MTIIHAKSTLYFLQSYPKLLLTIALFVATYVAHYHNDYLRYYPVNGTVIGHQTGYRNHLYLIIQTETHGILDREVSPALYHTIKDGDPFSFNARDLDINQSFTKNIFYMFVPAVLSSLSITGVIFNFGYILWKKIR